VGVRVALNLVKVFSIPAQQRLEEAQHSADDSRRMAMAMAVLAQTRLAAVRYTLVADEFLIWDEAVHDDELIVRNLTSSGQAGIDTELELIRARARSLASRINRDLAYANLQASVARLYNSVGYDAVPRDDEGRPVEELAKLIDARFGELEQASFSHKVAAVRPVVAAGLVTGAQPRIGKLVREGLGKGLETAGFTSNEQADVRVDLRLTLERPKDGVRVARVLVSALPRGSARPALTREFKTSLSEPVNDAQWRALGEGAVYKVIAELASRRITQASLRVAERLSVPGKPIKAKQLAPLSAAPLALRLDATFTQAAAPAEVPFHFEASR
jgi:hypothetical protein